MNDTSVHPTNGRYVEQSSHSITNDDRRKLNSDDQFCCGTNEHIAKIFWCDGAAGPPKRRGALGNLPPFFSGALDGPEILDESLYSPVVL